MNIEEEVHRRLVKADQAHARQQATTELLSATRLAGRALHFMPETPEDHMDREEIAEGIAILRRAAGRITARRIENES